MTGDPTWAKADLVLDKNGRVLKDRLGWVTSEYRKILIHDPQSGNRPQMP